MDLKAYLDETKQRPLHFARAAGVAPSTITRLLRGERGAGLDVQIKLAKASDFMITEFPQRASERAIAAPGT